MKPVFKKLLKITGILLLVFIVLLIPIFGIYAATVQSLPGDKLYSTKQNVELVIDEISLLSPTSYAYISLLKSQRRYQEVIGLANQNRDISQASQLMLEQSRKTLLDIQAVPDTGSRQNFIAQYQVFIANAKESYFYKATELREKLGEDKASQIKTFTVSEFEGLEGRLVAKSKALPQQAIKTQKTVPDELLISNIQQLEYAKNVLEALLK